MQQQQQHGNSRRANAQTKAQGRAHVVRGLGQHRLRGAVIGGCSTTITPCPFPPATRACWDEWRAPSPPTQLPVPRTYSLSMHKDPGVCFTANRNSDQTINVTSIHAPILAAFSKQMGKQQARAPSQPAAAPQVVLKCRSWQASKQRHFCTTRVAQARC